MLIHLLKISGTGCMITEKGRNYFMYQADEKRYETMKYHRCGASGLMLPELSLGLWHNFGDTGV